MDLLVSELDFLNFVLNNSTCKIKDMRLIQNVTEKVESAIPIAKEPPKLTPPIMRPSEPGKLNTEGERKEFAEKEKEFKAAYEQYTKEMSERDNKNIKIQLTATEILIIKQCILNFKNDISTSVQFRKPIIDLLDKFDIK